MMWNNSNKQTSEDDEDDSWEVRAFEEDTAGNLTGCTWPPRSYTCTFCRREFRSAQALGGHMNVHRRDRARLHHGARPIVSPTSPEASSLLIRTTTGQEFGPANGLCLLYPLTPDHNAILIPTPPMDFPSSVLAISPLSVNNPGHPTANNLASVSVRCHSTSAESSPLNRNNVNNYTGSDDKSEDASAVEELDLELRLGR